MDRTGRRDARGAARRVGLRLARDVLTDWLMRPWDLTLAAGGAGLDSEPAGMIRRDLGPVVGVAVAQTWEAAHLAVFLEGPPGCGAGAEAALRDSLARRGMAVVFHHAVAFAAAGARPVRGGDCIGSGDPGGGTGTLGCRVRDPATGDVFGLSCNHVLADCNAGVVNQTEIWAPGPGAGGGAGDRLGVLHDFVSIDFTPGAPNLVDAALVRADRGSDLDRAIGAGGPPAGVCATLGFGDAVHKTGHATGRTDGAYRYDINTLIDFGGGRQALFHNLVGIVGLTAGDFAARGDSGAALLDTTDGLAGLVISVATGIDLTLATPIRAVLDALSVEVE